jgi:hypothetical protein
MEWFVCACDFPQATLPEILDANRAKPSDHLLKALVCTQAAMQALIEQGDGSSIVRGSNRMTDVLRSNTRTRAPEAFASELLPVHPPEITFWPRTLIPPTQPCGARLAPQSTGSITPVMHRA